MILSKNTHKCRICHKNTSIIFSDLGYSPLANAYQKSLKKKETYYPLKVFFCNECKLPQLPEHQSAKKIFKEYDYFSSYSSSWIEHSQRYLKEIIKFAKLKKDSKICEIASNDGYLLQFFKEKGFKVLGIEPAKNVADVAINKGINTEKLFFGIVSAKRIKKKYGKQDLIIANNVLAHVPDILDFCAGVKNLMSKNGIATFEFPHFYNLINKRQFDTIYHEHFSYLTAHSIQKLFFKFKLEIFDIKKINTHGGSLRVFVKNKQNKSYKLTSALNKFLKLEKNSKIFTKKKFSQFNIQIQEIKKNTIDLLLNLKLNNKKVIAYGAPAKGNTFLNYCMIDNALIKFTVDKNPSKIGKFLPGSQIPILHPKKITSEKPDYIFILPWNLSKEIINQIKKIYTGAKYITAIPKVKILK
jgi:2-polyprenyl-3-methyl-5-hydroxy-6-metoxy-1,4-benzoquinol methylase